MKDSARRREIGDARGVSRPRVLAPHTPSTRKSQSQATYFFFFPPFFFLPPPFFLAPPAPPLAGGSGGGR